MGKYFGTDGFRGEAGIVLNADHAYRIGRFLGWYYGEQRRKAAAEGRIYNVSGPFGSVSGDGSAAERPKIVIGKDTRRSSYTFEYALVGGLTASGADAYLLHVTTTPSVAYVARVDDFDCGIMISASHNPYGDNGIKLINSSGEKMDDETIAKIEAYLDDPVDLPFSKGSDIGVTVDYISGRNRYIGYLISLGMYSFKGVRVALDCANGASWTIARSVFNALGADTFVINDAPNGENINLDCGSTHIEGLQDYVVQNRMDVGFAFDGDADRCIAVDENGKVVNGDGILYILGRYMKERGELMNNTVVATVVSNLGLEKSLAAEGIALARTDVGDRNVYDYMAKNNCRIGGEQTGHIIFTKYESTGDGIVTSLKLMEAMLAKKKRLGELAAPLEILPQAHANVRVSSNAMKDKVMADTEIGRIREEITAALKDTGRVLVRKSGTEPVIRVMVEAEDQRTSEKYVKEIADAIEARGYC